MKTPLLFALGLLICGAARAQTATAQTATTDNLRTLIISGGPNVQYNQYAIESNARYLEKLTDKSSWRRIYFADGKPGSRTISTIQSSPATKTARALSLVLGESPPDESIVAQASTLKSIDGASTKPSVTDVLGAFSQPAPDEHGLLYFTGHGSPGGSRNRPDYQNTTFALWNDNQISAREVARAVQNWPAKNPLFVVMVQCHSGGFANLIFQDGDPKKPLLDRDIAGFFSSTGERIAAGCTAEVNESDYQDFTTHFFAALSGTSREGSPVSGADYDHNGLISGSEAFAFANLTDLSIDVPVSTSDAYLRSVFAAENNEWRKTPYSQIIAGAQPWQSAMLDGLSAQLGLKGEGRLSASISELVKLQKRAANGDDSADMSGVDEAAIEARLQNLKSQLQTRFPGLKSSPKSKGYRAAHASAQQWLQARPADVNYLDNALAQYLRAQGAGDVRAAMLERFARGAYTVVLQNRLREKGAPEQLAAFIKLRAAEGRNPLK